MAFLKQKIDARYVTMPRLMFSERALEEYLLIEENDYTLENQLLRIEIDGKGCDGFTYAVGFSLPRVDDMKVLIEDTEKIVLIDPFSAFYLQVATVDFVQDFTQDAEGFVVVNHSQKHFAGKFWRANPDLTPPVIEQDPFDKKESHS